MSNNKNMFPPRMEAIKNYVSNTDKDTMFGDCRTDWQALKMTSNLHNEDRDCSVKALVVTTGKTYTECHTQLAALGRKPRTGSSMPCIVHAAKLLGWNMHPMDSLLANIKYRKGSGVTAKSAPNWLPNNRIFMLEFKNHVAGFYKGRVIDWTMTRNHRVTRIWELNEYEI